MYVLDIRQYDVLVTVVVRVRYVLIICTILIYGAYGWQRVCTALHGSTMTYIHNYIISNLRMRKKLQKKVRHNE